MKKEFIHRLIYKFVSLIIVFPVYKFIFRGKLVGIDNLPKDQSFIIVSNHGSLLDPPFLGHALGLRVSFMAKSELFNIPFLSQIIRACGAYPVKRGVADRSPINTASNKLLNNNTIGIFIDGTRQKNGLVNNPKKGAAMISAKTKKLLVPVAIINSHRLIQFKFFVPKFNKVIIKVGEPINYPKSSSKNDINLVTENLKKTINYLMG